MADWYGLESLSARWKVLNLMVEIFQIFVFSPIINLDSPLKFGLGNVIFVNAENTNFKNYKRTTKS